MRKRLIIRIWIIIAGLVLVMLLLLARLYFLQIVNVSAYRLEARHQYITTTNGVYDRGNIFMQDKNGNKIAAATMRSKFVLAIDPSKIKDPDNIYNKLNGIVSIDRDLYNKRVSKKEDPYEVILKGVSELDADKIRDLHLKNVILSSERERYYPGGKLGAQILGFVGFDENNNKVGRYGLERYYEDVLVRDSSKLYVNFFAELFTNISEVINNGDKEGDIVLTIDPDLQIFVEKELENTKKKWHSKMTSAIVMDPKTGEVLAMAVNPTFDLNNFRDTRGVSFANPLVSGVYEMGSIVKVLTMAVGLDTGVIKEGTTYNDKGRLELNGYTIHNYDNRGRGVVPMQEVLSQSLNTGAAFIARKVGHKKMREYFIDKLQLGEETGIDLPAETVGMVKNLKNERELAFATASFGQGVAFTPIATIRALGAIANGGYLVQPHIVKSIEYNTGRKKTFDYSDQRVQVFKKETSDIVAKMLTKVVDEVLAGGKYKMKNYSLGIKTGTAQLSTVGGYRDDAYLHTFMGYGPSYDARFIILLMNLEPKGAKYASQTLTDPFVHISRFLINHLDIPPDR